MRELRLQRQPAFDLRFVSTSMCQLARGRWARWLQNQVCSYCRPWAQMWRRLLRLLWFCLCRLCLCWANLCFLIFFCDLNQRGVFSCAHFPLLWQRVIEKDKQAKKRVICCSCLINRAVHFCASDPLNQSWRFSKSLSYLFDLKNAFDVDTQVEPIIILVVRREWRDPSGIESWEEFTTSLFSLFRYCRWSRETHVVCLLVW